MKCSLCNNSKVKEHLVVREDNNGHTHVHAPFENHNMVRRLICMLIAEANNNGMNLQLGEKDEKNY